jgi:hypothetical protein
LLVLPEGARQKPVDTVANDADFGEPDPAHWDSDA